jgi:hypothetical protein
MPEKRIRSRQTVTELKQESNQAGKATMDE